MLLKPRCAILLSVLFVLAFGFQSDCLGQDGGQVIVGEITVVHTSTIDSAPVIYESAIPNASQFVNGGVVDSQYTVTTPATTTYAESYPVAVANPINVTPVVVGQQFPAVAAEAVVPQSSSSITTRYVNGVATYFSNDYGYEGPGDMRTHLWNDHKQEMMAYGFVRAQVESMSPETAQKWHNFFHGTEGLPTEKQ